MVDVSEKAETERVAIASGAVRMLPATLALVAGGTAKKGDVLAVARVAGLQAAKRTAELIPLCHPVRTTGAEVAFDTTSRAGTIGIRAVVRALDRTGVEMEALTAVSVAALTIYDMLKAVDRGMRIDAVQLEEKRGGKSGTWRRGADA
jgi:cyclic pyranopterin phosphate synthase